MNVDILGCVLMEQCEKIEHIVEVAFQEKHFTGGRLAQFCFGYNLAS